MLVLSPWWPAGTAANPVKSLYTTIELKSCRPLGQSPAAPAWLCPGLPGTPVYIAQANSRQFVAFGANAHQHRAAQQSPKAPNSVFEEAGRRSTIEWRFVRRGDSERPYAAIMSYFVGQGEKRSRVLVVTRIEEGQSCHVAYIDAGHPEAIVLARTIADGEARSFDCRLEPKRTGAAAAD